MVPKSAGATSLATCGTVVAFYVDGFDYRSYGSIGKYRSIYQFLMCSGFPHDLLICYYTIHRYSLFERLNCHA